MKFKLLLGLMLTSMSLLAQFPKEQYKTGPVIWFGIDYTSCSMTGADGYTDQNIISQAYFDGWNEFVEVESEKYDIPKYLNKPDIQIDLTKVKEKNATIHPDSIINERKDKLSKQEIEKKISRYNFDKSLGIGVVMFAEYYSKEDNEASYALVVFNIEDKSILGAKRYVVEPGGFGFRNYWAKTIYTTLKLASRDVKRWLR